MNNLAFRMMTHLGMPLRDRLMPPDAMLAEAGPRPGWRVLDYGCGPGTFVIKAAEAVGPSGEVTGLDIQPLALRYVEKRAAKAGLSNVRTMTPEGTASVPDASLDLVILFDVYHMLPDGPAVLSEIRRMLKSGGRLAFSDHHLDAADLGPAITAHGAWIAEDIGRYTMNFRAA